MTAARVVSSRRRWMPSRRARAEPLDTIAHKANSRTQEALPLLRRVRRMTRTPLSVVRAESRGVEYSPLARGSVRARTVAPAVPLGVLALVLVLHRAWAMGAPTPVVAALLGMAFAGGLARARSELHTRQARVALGTALAVTALFVILPLLTPPGERIVPSAFSAAVPAVVGWSLVLWLPGIGSRAETSGEPWRWLRDPPGILLAGAAAAYLAILAALLYDAAGSYVVLQDEA